MAIDSANKRFSIMNMRSPIIRPIFIPDGTVNDGDKYHMLNLYYGIALDPPPAVSPVKQVRRYIMNINRMGLR